MSGRMKLNIHLLFSDFHFLAVSGTAHPKKSYFDFISRFIIMSILVVSFKIQPELTLRPIMIMFLCHKKLILKQINNANG